MELLNTAISWWDFFSIYAFHTEPDKMALASSPRCGMLIVGSWTVCLFFIFSCMCHSQQTARWGSRKARVFSLALEPWNWQASPHPQGSTSLVGGGRGATLSQSRGVFLFFRQSGLSLQSCVPCPGTLCLLHPLLGSGTRRPLGPRLPWRQWFPLLWDLQLS